MSLDTTSTSLFCSSKRSLGQSSEKRAKLGPIELVWGQKWRRNMATKMSLEEGALHDLQRLQERADRY